MGRKYGISSATFYTWKAKYGGLEASDARKLRALEDENAKLKKILAEAMHDNAILKDVAAKNGDALRKAGGGGHACIAHGVSQRWACEALGIDRACATDAFVLMTEICGTP